MKLSDLLVFDNIVIQCHDNPDADAIGSGFAVYSYLKSHGKNVRLIYSGFTKISKSNLVFLVDSFDIPIEHVENDIGSPDLLLTVDCQYGEGNVTKFDAPNIAVIDHHQVAKDKVLPELREIRSGIGSCSTIIWDMLKKEKFEFTPDICTVLYYGLFTDTNSLTEIFHPLDKDMQEDIYYDASVIRRLCGMNLSLDEAKIAGVALLGVEYHPDHKYAILQAQPCDPNILGLISDFFLSVDSVDVCLVYAVLDYGIKYSVRSDTAEVRADELAAYIAKRIGSGGGHTDKAGGFLQNELRKQRYENYANAGEKDRVLAVTSILREKMHGYFTDSDIIYAGKTKLNKRGMKEYAKIPMAQGYVIPAEFIPLGTRILVRSLEGDINLMVEKDTVVMIGVRGEVWPTKQATFKKNYKKLRGKYDLTLEYSPTMKLLSTLETVDLIPHAHMCISTGQNHIMAKPLRKATKVFTKWHKNEYLKGEPGDYIAFKTTDPDDIYIIGKEFFEDTYAPAEKKS